MSAGKTLAVVLLSVLLVGSLAGASAAIGADRTAFDADYVVETFEGENVHGSLAAEVRANATESFEQSTDPGSLPPGVTVDLDERQALNESVTDEVVRQQLDAHVRELYAYLHGDREDLSLVTDLASVRASLNETIVNATTIDTATLVGASSEDIEAERVAKLSQDEQAYQEAQIELPPGERERIEEDLATSARENLSGQPDPLVDAVLSLQATVLDGLTGELTHEEYVEQRAADEQQVKEEIAAAALAELPEQQPVFAEDDDPESQFAPFRTAVGWGTTLAWLLPMLALGLVAGVYGVTRSVDRTAAVTASALFWAGLTWVVLGLFARGLLLGTVEPDGATSNPLAEGLFAVVDGTLRTIGVQSVLLVLTGVALYAVVYADRRGKLDQVRDRAGYPPRRSSARASSEPSRE